MDQKFGVILVGVCSRERRYSFGYGAICYIIGKTATHISLEVDLFPLIDAASCLLSGWADHVE